jgi:hypothetical protein
MGNTSGNPFAWFGRMSKQNPQWAKDINGVGSMSGIDNANTTMGYMKAGGQFAKGDIKGGLATGADTYLRAAVPVYGAIQTFNDITGGIRFDKMLNPKKPVYDESKLAAKAMNASMIESQKNLGSQQIRDAMEQRQAIKPQYEKVQSDLLDMLTQGVSSRQLAPIYGAGESRNRAIGAASEAALAQNLASRGVGGGIQAGVEQANLAAQNARSAELNNAITQQQIEQRPQMLNMAANLLATKDAQAAADIRAGQELNLSSAQMALNQANLERQQKMQEDAIARANRQQEMENIGNVLALLEPELERVRNRTKKPTNKPFVPTNVQNTPENTPGYGMGLTVDEGPEVTMDMPQPEDSMITRRDYINAGRAQPQNIAGELQQVTDIPTMQKIDKAKNKSFIEDLGNGLSVFAYYDRKTGRYLKQYIRSNPEYIGTPITNDATLRQSETNPLMRNRPSGGDALATTFYG